MPIKQAIDHPNRVILAVGSGELTLANLATFTRDIVRAELLHYSKLIDVANCTPGFVHYDRPGTRGRCGVGRTNSV